MFPKTFLSTDEDDDVDGLTQGSAKDAQISTDSSKMNSSGGCWLGVAFYLKKKT